MLISNANQIRHSLPAHIPERSVSIAHESSAVSPTSSSRPPQIDLLEEFTQDGLQRSSTFRDGLEKAVNDINTKYGDSAKTYINSTSPTNSVAVRNKNTFRPRYLVPTYVDAPNSRPVIGELWTTLKNHEDGLSKGTEPPRETVDELYGSMSPFHDSHQVYTDCTGSETSESPDVVSDTAVANSDSASTSPLSQTTSAEHLIVVQKENKNDNPRNCQLECAPSVKINEAPALANDDDGESAFGLSETTTTHNVDPSEPLRVWNITCDPSDKAVDYVDAVSTRNERADHGTILQDENPATGGSRCRNSSAPSVAALVSKFRRMERNPEHEEQADTAQEQDEASLESNSRFIQSYRHRSEDSDNEDSLLSTESSENTANMRKPMHPLH